MATELQNLEAAIAALEAQRELLGDDVVDLAIAPLRARLQTAGGESQKLKQVTIVFLDVVGSTALSRSLDPEDIHALLDGLLADCTAAIGARGGKVLQYAGDSLLAVFGADAAREDDAEQAVRAGLDLLQEGRRHGGRVQRLHGHDGFDVRVGIHTGNVLLGGGVDGDGSIRGAAVNIAARLEQTAPAGGLRISRDTYRFVRDLFEVQAQPPLEVKGIGAPLTSYLVLRPTERDPQSASSNARTPLIGRETELGELLRALDAATASRSPRLVTVVADAGVGKSRLLTELENRLAISSPRARRLRGRAQRHGLNVPHGVARDLLARHSGILLSDSPEAARDKLARSFAPVFGDLAEEQSALVGHLIGLDFSTDPHIAGILQDGRQIRSRAFHAIAEFVRRQARGAPAVVLLFDDLHWADDGSLDLIEHLASACGDVPLLVGCFARPALIERRPGWAAGVAQARRIVLEPLDGAASAQLADALLAPEPDPELRELLMRSAEGNPFHMEELLGMLVDEGVVVRGAAGWGIDRERLSIARVPPTLTAVLQARLDALPAAERLALQRDSVIGHVFWDRALAAVAPDSLPALPALLERALIRLRDGSVFADAREYAFKHHVLQQVTYDTVLKAVRRDLHLATADWLVAVTGDRVGEHLGVVADHYERGGDRVRAAEYLLRAADAAYSAAAFGDARSALDRAMALLLPGDTQRRFELLMLRVQVSNALGRRDEQAADATSLEALADELDDDLLRAKAAGCSAAIATIAGHFAEALAETDRAAALAQAVDDEELLASALLNKAQVLTFAQDRDGALTCLQRVLAITGDAQTSVMLTKRIVALNRLNVIEQRRGDYAAGLRHLTAALASARDLRNRRFEGGLLSNMGSLQVELGHLDAAEALIRRGLDVSRAIGDRGSEPYAIQNLGEIALRRGDRDAAMALTSEAREVARSVGDKACEAGCARMMGTVHAARAETAAALACWDAYDLWADDATIAAGARETTLDRAELALADGRLDEALSLVARVTEWIDARPPAAAGELESTDIRRCFVCHRVLAAAKAADAGRWLERAHALLVAHAAPLSASDRASYLGNPLHRQVVAQWAVRHAATPGNEAG